MGRETDNEQGVAAPPSRTDPLSEIVLASPDFVSWSTVEGDIQFINPAGRTMVGLGPTEPVAGLRIARLHPAWAQRLVLEEGLPRAAAGQKWEGETALLHADGSEIPVLQTIMGHRGAADELQYLSTICRDLRPFRRVQLAVQQSERRYRAFVDASPMGIHSYELRPDGRLVFVGGNPGADRILGIDNSAFIGKTIEDAFPPLVGTEIPQRYREAAAHGRLWHTEQIAYDHGSIQGAYEVYAFQTGPGAMAAMFLDITERKQAEAAREKLEAQVRQGHKMEALGRLAGGVAHDFNNLLTVIAGYAQNLQLALPPESPLRAEVNEIADAADRATGLTRQLLSFARKQAVIVRVVDANDLLRDAQNMVGRLIGDDVRLEFRPADTLWRIRIDPSQLEQVLINLVVNGRDAMPAGGTLTIATTNEIRPMVVGLEPNAEAEARRVVMLTVCDNGTGMSPETVAHAFEPFYSTKAPGKGTGLGLATVYAIVQQAGGFVEVDSALEQGTTIRVGFPAVDEEPAQPTRDVARRRRGSETVLIVEDDPAVRTLCIRLVEQLGYSVHSAASGVEAIELAGSLDAPMALLLTDVVMPGMNGRELFRQLHSLWPDLKVLYMSGFDEQAVAHRVSVTEGPLLQKPFTLEALSVQLRAVLDER